MPHFNQKTQAILLVIASALCFALMNAFVRLSGDLPTVQKCFFRNLIAVFFAAAILWRERPDLSSQRQHLPGLIMRAIFGTVGLTCNYYAVDHMLLADASMLNRLSSFSTVLLSWIFLREPLNRVQAASIITAFIGALCIIRPGFDALTTFPALVAFIGGVGAGAAYTVVRRLTQRGANKTLIVFFFSCFSCLLMLPPTLLNLQPMTPTQLLILLLAGLAAAGGQFTLTYAYSKAPAREISVFDYTIVLFAGLLGFCLFDQMPDALSFLGYFIIIGVSIAMFIYNNKQEEVPPNDH